MENILKALNLSNTETAIAQEEISKEISQLVNYEHPLRVNMPRKTGSQGSGHSVIRRSAPGTLCATVC